MIKKEVVLVTGASGRIGKYLVKKLLEKKYNVRILIHKTRIDSFDLNNFDKEDQKNIIKNESLVSAWVLNLYWDITGNIAYYIEFSEMIGKVSLKEILI